MEIIIFQLLSCLYLYDSSIPVPVRINKQIRYTYFWPVALIIVPPVYRLLAVALLYRATGIPTSGAVVKFAQSRYTVFWRPKG